MKKYLLPILSSAILAFSSAHGATLADNINSGKKPKAEDARPLPVAITPNEAQKATLASVETYLNSLTTIVADFMQVAQDGSVMGGKFFLARPAKMRWQYDPPTPVLMLTVGKNLVYYDYELQQVSDIPIDSTLAGFLARKDIKFDHTVIVTAVENESGIIRISLAQSKRPKDGSLTLEFIESPMVIRNMIVTDSNGQETTVSLNNAQFGVPVDNELFKFSDPRYGKKKR